MADTEDTSTSSSLFDRQFDLLKTELNFCNNAICQHDEITKSIKNWSIVTWTASVGLAMSTNELRPYVWFTTVIPLVFWIVDASFRRIQRSFIVRVREIGQYVNSEDFVHEADAGTPINFELMVMRTRYADWGTPFQNWQKNTFLGVMLFRSVSLLYVGLIVVSLLVWLFAPDVVASQE